MPGMNIDFSDPDFGAVLNCAVRYALGRRTYMPSLVVDFITPLLPVLDNKTLYCFDQDITDQRYHGGGYGDPLIDEPVWMKFHEDVKSEQIKRGNRLYKDWRG